jgi:hypothetical protein
VLHQRQDAIPDQRRRRLVPRDEEGDRGAEQLVHRELVAFCLGCDELRQDAAVGLGTLDRDELRQVRPSLDQHRLRGEQRRLSRLVAALEGQQVIGPATELRGVGARHSEDRRQDRHRQGEGELFDELGVSARLHQIEQLVDDRLDPWPHRLDRGRGERLEHETADAGVVRRVRVDEPLGLVVPAEGREPLP